MYIPPVPHAPALGAGVCFAGRRCGVLGVPGRCVARDSGGVAAIWWTGFIYVRRFCSRSSSMRARTGDGGRRRRGHRGVSLRGRSRAKPCSTAGCPLFLPLEWPSGLSTFAAAARLPRVRGSGCAVPSADSLQPGTRCSAPSRTRGTGATCSTADRIAEAFRHGPGGGSRRSGRCLPAGLGGREVVEPEHVALGHPEGGSWGDRYAESRPARAERLPGNGDVTPAWSTRTGTKADFQRLKDLGVDCTGKVVIARYGGNCGYKARFRRPRARGAHHLPDPADTGYAGVRPEGGYANDLHPARLAQHHRLRRRPAPPFQPATKDARRSTRHRRPAADPVQPRLARRRRSSRG